MMKKWVVKEVITGLRMGNEGQMMASKGWANYVLYFVIVRDGV
jgi:hypothetical protein